MKKRFKAILALVLASGLTVGWNLQNQQMAEALLGSNTRINDGYSAVISDAGAQEPKLSNDGNLVVFSSISTNLVPGDTNAKSDVFLKNIITGTTTRVSVDSSGAQANGGSGGAILSGDGRYIFYSSNATNLVSGDTNATSDIFKYTISSGATERISVDSSGAQANGGSYSVDSDNEGRFIVFTSSASNLTTVSDTNSNDDIFTKDTTTGAINHISQTTGGIAGNSYSVNPKISCDGRFVGFSSAASNLVTSDSNGYKDAFIADTLGTLIITNTTRTANNASDFIDISCDGSYLLINSSASNLGVDPYVGAVDAFRYTRSTGTFEGASTRENGTSPTQSSVGDAISSDGRYILFRASGSSFITSMTDTNSADDIFLRDMSATGFRLVSKATTGTVGDFYSIQGTFSGTNRIAFTSKATNLVSSGPTDNNGQPDIFIVDVGTPNTCSF